MEHLIGNRILACIPWIVLEELDGLKRRTDVGFDAREAIRNLEILRQERSPFLKIVKEMAWEDIEFLDHNNNDHKIIAAANMMKKDFPKVKLVSKDSMFRIKVRELGFKAEDYYRDQTKDGNHRELTRINISHDEIHKKSFTFDCHPKLHSEIANNQGVVCISDWKADFKRPNETADTKERS